MFQHWRLLQTISSPRESNVGKDIGIQKTKYFSSLMLLCSLKASFYLYNIPKPCPLQDNMPAGGGDRYSRGVVFRTARVERLRILSYVAPFP